MQARLLALDWVARGNPSINDGQYFASRLPDFYAEGLRILGRHHLQVVEANPASEFCLGDRPVITSRHDRPGYGPHQRIALGDAQMIAMPLSGRFALAVISHANDYVVAAPELVENFNLSQLHAAKRFVLCRPNSVLATELAAWSRQAA